MDFLNSCLTVKSSDKSSFSITAVPGDFISLTLRPDCAGIYEIKFIPFDSSI